MKSNTAVIGKTDEGDVPQTGLSIEPALGRRSSPTAVGGEQEQ